MATIRHRCGKSSKRDKSRVLGEFTAITHYPRKHGIRLLAQSGGSVERLPVARGRYISDEQVREAVIVVWEASDRIWGMSRAAGCWAIRAEEVKRRCRTVLQSKAEELLRNLPSHFSYHANVHPTLALV